MPDYSKELWEFKYAPEKMEDLILPDKYIKLFSNWLKNKTFENCLLVSNKPGAGKTSIIRILKNSELFSTMFINSSIETSIDTVRYNIKKFISTSSPIKKAVKIVFLDEADRMSAGALDALKGEIEGSASNARFIFTANRESAFPEPIISRVKVFNFDKIFSENKQELYKKAYIYVTNILDKENIKYDQKAIAQIIQKYAPDWRNLIKTLQLISAYNNEITIEDVKKIDVTSELRESVIGYIKNKDFKSVREFCVRNIGNEHEVINELYKLTKIPNIIEPTTIPEMILILAETNRYINIVPDREIEMLRAFIDIMLQVKFI